MVAPAAQPTSHHEASTRAGCRSHTFPVCAWLPRACRVVPMSGLRKRKRSPVGDGSSQRVTRARAHAVHRRAGARTRAASRAQSPPGTTATPKQRQPTATAHAAPVVPESGAPTRRSARVQRSAPAQRGGRGRRRGSAVATGASRPPPLTPAPPPGVGPREERERLTRQSVKGVRRQSRTRRWSRRATAWPARGRDHGPAAPRQRHPV